MSEHLPGCEANWCRFCGEVREYKQHTEGHQFAPMKCTMSCELGRLRAENKELREFLDKEKSIQLICVSIYNELRDRVAELEDWQGRALPKLEHARFQLAEEADSTKDEDIFEELEQLVQLIAEAQDGRNN